ncbi:MAG: 5-bromo-4-chloroindolyl phosphate hydrolysis family protein [Clostridia bacterium]|nr:5-bromo-4-chloroindolyl phosphate hydrolysis family protein [Clostridia bacterium]
MKNNNEYWLDVDNKILDSISDFAHNASDVISKMDYKDKQSEGIIDYKNIADDISKNKVKWWRIVIKYILAGTLVVPALALLTCGLIFNFLPLEILLITTMLLCMPSLALLTSANSDVKLKRLIKEYIPIIGQRPEISVAYLESVIGKNKKHIIKDISQLLKKQVFPQVSYYDKKLGILVLDGYKEDTSDNEQGKCNITNVLTEWINKLSICILEIKSIDVCQKTHILIDYVNRIKSYVVENPSCERKLRSFINYYLPTTVKLLESYIKIEKIGTYGDNLNDTKKRIENSLGMLEAAYKNQLESLYFNETIDISSDIDVLEQMMKKDGLNF